MAKIFYANFKDDRGDGWQVSIYDDEFSGTAGAVSIGSEGFVLSYEGDQSNPFQRIIPSKLEFSVYLRSTNFETWITSTVLSRAEGQLKVEVRKDPAGDDDLWWAGVILIDQVTIPDNYDAMVRITASDGLALLKLNKNVHNAQPIDELLAELLAELPTAEFWATGAGFLRYVNDYESLSYAGTNWLGDAEVLLPRNYKELTFTGAPTNYDTYRKLEAVLSAFNMRLFQSEGHYYALPLTYYEQIVDGSNPSTIFRQVDKAGTAVTLTFFEASYLNDNKIAEEDANFNRMAGGQITHLAPKKRIRITREMRGLEFLYRDIQSAASPYEDISGHVGDTNGVLYPTGTKLRIEASNSWLRDPDSPIVGDASLVTLKLRVQLLVGTKYYNGSSWQDTATTFDIDVLEFLRDTVTIDLVEVWSYTTSELPVDGDGMTFTGTFKFIDGTDTEVSDEMEDGLLGWNVVLKVDNDSVLTDIVYQAETSEDNYDDIDLPSTIIGSFDASGVSLVAAANGGIEVSGSYPEFFQGYTWDGNPAAGAPLLTLVTDDALRMMQFPTVVRSHSYLWDVPKMWQVVKIGTQYFAPFTMSTQMNARQSSIEMWLIEYDGANITGSVGPLDEITPIPSAGLTGTGAVTSYNGITPDVTGDITDTTANDNLILTTFLNG